MPALFVGHGSPINILENNEYTRGWKQIAESFPRPSVILSISAHWFTGHTGIYTGDAPRTIHDFYGFPRALYEIGYPAPGAPETALKALRLLDGIALEDNSWGLDHGTWSVLHTMYPNADIPVFQMGIDKDAPPEAHFQIGRLLRPLRDENVLILGSGNIVHNLALIDFEKEGGFEWAYEFDRYIDTAVRQKSLDELIHYERAGASSSLSFFSPDHYYPLLYVLGAAYDDDEILDYNHACMAGSLSMTSYVFKNSNQNNA